MRITVTLALALLLTLVAPAALSAQVVVRPHDAGAAARPLSQPADPLAALGEKIDQPADVLVVPFFDVDTTSASGTTTLFAVRNIRSQPLDIEIRYLAPNAMVLRTDNVTLNARQTLTKNVRDVSGLPADGDGHARGYIAILLDSMEPTADNLVGDYLQVDVGNNFATGDRMVSLVDLCEKQEIRFLDFGAGTELRFLVNQPQGSDPMTDAPSVTVTPIGEDGAVFPSTDVYSSDFSFVLHSDDFTSLHFGSLLFDFSSSNGGAVYGEYSAEGKFSVGLNSACTVQ